MVAHADALKTLELFNEKADQLLASEFFNHVSGSGAILEFNRESGWQAIYVGPDDESTRAVILTLRLFMQDNDRISLARMADLYKSLLVSSAVKREFDAHRAGLNGFLESKSPLAISEDGPLTYRDILSIFVYGEYAHVNARHRQTFEDLQTTPFFPMFQNCLVDALVVFARCISTLRRTNEAGLSELRTQASAS